MGAKLLLAAMLVGTPTVMVLGARDDAPTPAPSPSRYQEKPWLTREAASELVAPDGGLGPLFAGLILGGSEPPEAIRERIRAFAKQHGVDIALQMKDGDVTAVKLGVTFDGGYGYQGADVLALRWNRPSRGRCCVCGPSDYWFDDWGLGLDDGNYVHVSVRVNRLEAEWLAEMSTTEVVDLADSLVGTRMADVRRRFGKRVVGDAIEIAYARGGPFVSAYGEFAMSLSVTDGRVDGTRVGLRRWTSAEEQESTEVLLQRLGTPTKSEDGWTWRRGDKIFEVSDYGALRVTQARDAAP